MPDVTGICLVPGCDQEITVTDIKVGDRVEVKHISATEHKVSIKPRVLPIPDRPLGEPVDPNIVPEVERGGGRF